MCLFMGFWCVCGIFVCLFVGFLALLPGVWDEQNGGEEANSGNVLGNGSGKFGQQVGSCAGTEFVVVLPDPPFPGNGEIRNTLLGLWVTPKPRMSP